MTSHRFSTAISRRVVRHDVANWLRKRLAFLATIKMAVINISLIAIALATATVLESVYDTATARYWVYRSVWFTGLLVSFGTNLAAVMVDRWPWKRNHIEFLLAHIGILMLLTGGWVTGRFGLDGQLQLSEGETSGVVELPDSYRVSLITPSGHRLSQAIAWMPPERTFHPTQWTWEPTSEEPALPTVDWTGFLSHADVETAPEATGGTHPAVKLSISGGPMKLNQEVWLWAGDPSWSQMQMGPAEFILLPSPDWPFSGPTAHSAGSGAKPAGRARLEVVPVGDTLKWNAISIRGEQRQGSVSLRNLKKASFEPGWMGLKIQVAEWLPLARLHSKIKAARIQEGDQAPPPAIQVQAPGSSERQWLSLGERAVWQDAQGREWQVVFHTERVYLPFGLKLRRFEIQHDPGTRNPASFASEVEVHEKLGKDAAGESAAGIWIRMNQPLEFKGFTFYQASYVPGIPRPTISIFSVNRDPGRTLKYLGSILLVLGSALLFWKKTRAQRMNVADSVGKAMLLVLFATAGAQAAPPSKGADWSFTTLGQVPVQSGGRFKPLDTLARDTVLSVTGSRSFGNWSAVEIMLSWMMDPKAWSTENLIRVGHPDVRRQLLLNGDQTRFSLNDLVENSALGQYAQSRASASSESRSGSQVGVPSGKRDLRDQELNRVLERIQKLRAVVSGELITIAPSDDVATGWKAVGEDEASRTRWIALLQAYGQGNQELFERVSQDLLDRGMAALQPAERNRLQAEFAYNRFQFFRLAMLGYLAAGLLWIFSRRRGASLWIRRSAFSLTALAFIAHAIGFGLRCYVAGRPPVSNMYESVIWVAFGALVFSAILYSRLKNTLLLAVGSWISGLVLLSADASPLVLDPTISPLVPVLRSNYWLTIHVLTITASYAAFALCMGLGNIALGWAARNRLRPLEGFERKFQVLNQLNYRAMQIGVVLLAAGTILGGVWADESWGRFWGWDPKEVWALTALLVYIAILHGRYTGWIRGFGYALSSVLGFLSVVMAWYGVNFVLGVGLHSYGFSTGGLSFMATFCILQFAYAMLVWLWVKSGSGPLAKSAAHLLLIAAITSVFGISHSEAQISRSQLEQQETQSTLLEEFTLSRNLTPIFRNFSYDPGQDIMLAHHFWDLRCTQYRVSLPMWMDVRPVGALRDHSSGGGSIWSADVRSNPQERLGSVVLIEVETEIASVNADGNRYNTSRLDAAMSSALSTARTLNQAAPTSLCRLFRTADAVLGRPRVAGAQMPTARRLTLWDDVIREGYLRSVGGGLTNLDIPVQFRTQRHSFWVPLNHQFCEFGHLRGRLVGGTPRNIATPAVAEDDLDRPWTELFGTGDSMLQSRLRGQFCSRVRQAAFDRLVDRCGFWQARGVAVTAEEAESMRGVPVATRIAAVQSTCESIRSWGEPWVSRYRNALQARVAALNAVGANSTPVPAGMQHWTWMPQLFSN